MEVLEHDATDRVFGRLTARYRFRNEAGVLVWHYDCTCGGSVDVRLSVLNVGHKLSCGCLQAESRHGYASRREEVPEYNAYHNMKDRCSNPNNPQFKDYGGRGIVVCDRWLHGEGGRLPFLCFLDDVGPKPSPRHSIERLRGDGPYSPNNCVWTTIDKQARNKRTNVRVRHLGCEMVLKDALRAAGKSYEQYYGLKKTRGLSPQEAFDLVLITPLNVSMRRPNYRLVARA